MFLVCSLGMRQAGPIPSCNTHVPPVLRHARLKQRLVRPGVTPKRSLSVAVHSPVSAPGTGASPKSISQGAWSRRPSAAPSDKADVQLLQPFCPPDRHVEHLLVYLPGTDGTGQAIVPQISGLQELGFEICPNALGVPGSWAGGRAKPRRVTIVGESFGACLGLRLALEVPEVIERMVLVNPATCFSSSWNGLASLVSATNLLTFFPKALYTTAQATLLPLLVDTARVGPEGTELLKSMIFMKPPPGTQVLGDASGTRNDGRRGVLFSPAGAASFRANLLRTGALPDDLMRCVDTPILLVSSARDRLFPSIEEGARLQRLLRNAKRVILPDSAHAALMERDVSLSKLMVQAGFAPQGSKPADGQADMRTNGNGPVTSNIISSSNSSSKSSNGNGRAAEEPQYAYVSVDSSIHPRNSNNALNNTSGHDNGSTSTATIGFGRISGARTGAQESSSSNGSRKAQLPSTTRASVTAFAGAASPASPAPATSNYVDSAMTASSRSSVNNTRSSGLGASTPGGPDAAIGGGDTKSDGRPQLSGSPTDIARAAGVDPFAKWSQRLAPWRDLVSPVVLGAECLPVPGSAEFARPMLFVGNHQKMGFYDTPLLVQELYLRGYSVRGLAHPGHWAGPVGPFFEEFGAVKASPMAAYRLLRSGEKVLLFPGGAKEVVKKRGQEYTLLWKDSPDFVRLAAKCEALIVPFAAVGADDAYDVMMETDDLLAHPVLGAIARGIMSRVDSTDLSAADSFFPITRLPVLGLPTPVPIPNLQRLYFKFGTPVDTHALAADLKRPQEAEKLYCTVRTSVEQMLEELLAVRAADEDSQVLPRLSKAVSRFLPYFGSAASSGMDVNKDGS